jgi:hypothetical protein
MSDDWITLIPEDPRLVPDQHRRLLAQDRLKQIAPEAWEITAEVSDGIRFVDAGANWEGILCPTCASRVDEDWWSVKMTEEYQNSYPLKAYALPCCGAKHTLHDLNYVWPQGFARFELSAMNPNIGKLSDTAKRDLEAVLGTPLRVIYRHI